jgi:hypothetical protein
VKPPETDTHEDQEVRLADYMEIHHEATCAELATARDCACVTKVQSAMRLTMGYGIRRGWRWVLCAGATKRRRGRTYTLTHRPELPRQLPLDLSE